jgi:hypothetical protein
MNSKKFNLNGSSMGAGYWGEKPKKKPINKLDPNRIDENDESKESYKMNNMITSSRSDENIYSMNKLKRKAPIGSSKSDENDHSYLIKEKELQEKRKRRIPLFKNENEPINFLAEPIRLVHHVDPIAKPPLDFNSIKKSLSNKVDSILLNPSNLTYRLEPKNQTYRIEKEIIPKNEVSKHNSNNNHFKTDNEAQSNETNFIHRIKSEEKNLNKISDTPKIKLFETGNNNKQKYTPTRIDSTQIQGVEEPEILNLNILPQNETNQIGEKIKKPETINTKPKTSRKQDDNSTNEASQYPEKTPKPKTANKQDTSKTDEPSQNPEKITKPKTAHRQDENSVFQKTNKPYQNPEKITKPKTAHTQDENKIPSKTNEATQNLSKIPKPKTAHREKIEYINQKPTVSDKNSKPKTTYKQEDHTHLIQSEMIKNSSQKKSPGVNDDLIDQKKETKSVQKTKMNLSVHENQNDPINSPKNYKIISSPLKDNVTKSSGTEKPKRETKTAKKLNNESIPTTKSGNKIVTKKITPDQQISKSNKEINTDSPDRSKLFQVNNNQQISEFVPKTSTPAPVLIQVSPIDNNDDQGLESVQTSEPKSHTNIDMNSIHEDELIKEDLSYSPNENNVDESSVKYEKLNNEIESSQLSVDSHIAIQNELSTSSLIQNKKKKSTHYFSDFMNTLKHKKDEIIEKRNKRTTEDRKKSHIKLINICSILLCVLCPLTGLLSIYYSRKAKKYFEMKDIENTKKILNRTEWMLISTVFIGTIFVIGILAFLAFYLNWVSF